jgi:peptide subunit release factor 1 (eRF1)
MDVIKEVRALANWPESGHLVFSLYLDTKWSDAQQREKVRIFVKDRLKQVEKDHASRRARWEELEEDVGWIREYVDGLVAQHHDTEYDGIAVFACGAEGLRTVIRSRISFPNRFFLAPRPRIRPLAHLYDEYEAAAFADIGRTDASIYLIRAGEIEEHHRSETRPQPEGRTGHYSTPRIESRAEDHMHRHHQEVAEQLVRLVHREEVRNIVLSGTEHVVASFRRHLPKGVDEYVIAHLSLDRDPSRDAVVSATVEALRDAERRREENVVRQVIELQANPSRVAVGMPRVLRALEQGRVHRLLVSDGLERQGFRCAACGKLGESPPESCELCGEPVVSTDLVEAMVVSAVQRGAEIDEIPGNAAFEELGGVAALLRY